VNFQPDLTPAQMLAKGVFGRSYFEMATPADFLGLDPLVEVQARLETGKFDKRRNFYAAKAGEDFAAWTRNGWIFPEDPLGWFHWYCRFSNGRRHSRDAHQIQRYNNYRERWGSYARGQKRSKGDASLVVKQGLLQWACDPEVVLAL